MPLETIKKENNIKNSNSQKSIKKSKTSKEKTVTSSHLINLYKKWRSVQPLPEENNQALWQWIRLRFSYHSNQFEGNNLVYDETQLLLIHGRAVGDHTIREYEEMKAHNVTNIYHQCVSAQQIAKYPREKQEQNILCLKDHIKEVKREFF